jgi:predicted nucleic acid-binding Zn ribbon protein
MKNNKKGKPEKVGLILDTVLTKSGLINRFNERTVLHRWPEIVGQRASEHTTAVDLSNGILTVDADHSAWKQELTLLFPIIKKKFNELCGEGTVTVVRWKHSATKEPKDDNRR